MNNLKQNRNIWHEMVPRGRPAIISLAIVAVVAFSLGGFLLGGSEANVTEPDEGVHSHSESSSSAEPTLWTCSMHPQIQLPKPGKCPICFMDLIPVETGSPGDGLEPDQIRMSETAVKLAGIQTTPVIRAYAERSIRMVGKLDYDETRVSYITAWVPGRIDSLFIDYTGARVSKGDNMVQLYSPELIAAQEELIQAKKATDILGSTSSSVLKTTSRETLRSAREKLRLYGLSEKQIDSIERGGTPSEHLIITAPSSGTVVHKDAKEGMYVSTGNRIYTIAELSKLWVMLEAYESDLPWLQTGQHVTFSSPSFPGESFDAIIDFIDPVVDPKSRTVEIRAVVDNKNGRLKPEMFVSGTVKSRLDGDGSIISTVHDGRKSTGQRPLLIPASAPLITGTRAIVYVNVPDKVGVIFEGREVTLGPRARDYYVVKAGLNEGEEVVINGAFKIDSELQIQAKPSMMSPNGDMKALVQRQSKPESMAKHVKSKTSPYKAGAAKRLDNCEAAQDALTPVYEAYFKIQMALANDDVYSAKNAFSDLATSVSGIDIELFKDRAHEIWMRISRELANRTNTGKLAKDIGDARNAFYHTSLAIIELHDTFGHAGDSSFYLTYCPMARDNAGAYWLQQANIVWNSFYGESMLRCGEIKQELHAGNLTSE